MVENKAAFSEIIARSAFCKDLTQRETLDVTRKLIGGTSELNDRWVSERVRGIRYNGVNVLTVDWDSIREPNLDDTIKQLISSPQTGGVVVEYFTPELAKKAREVPLLGKMWEQKVLQPTNKSADQTRLHYGSQYARRLAFAKEVTQALQTGKKDAVCLDIANKPLYMMLRDGRVLAEMFVGHQLGKGVDTLFAKAQKDTNGLFAALGHDVPLFTWAWLQVFHQIVRKGIYDPQRVNAFDKYQLHLEDARRLVIAEGIMQHIDRIALTSGVNDNVLLVIYPKAHNLRIRDYMKQVSSNDRTAMFRLKDRVYRLASGPLLDFEERTYRYDGKAWQRISTHPVKRASTTSMIAERIVDFREINKPKAGDTALGDRQVLYGQAKAAVA